ncbi:MAG: hypothetical protein QNI91_15465 [Arenicellales bacterium]|nr:hypothetical protein [Arenicellales bacterium]
MNRVGAKFKTPLTRSAGMHGSQPLYSRVPTRDENGKFLADFMVLISGLRAWPSAKQTATVDKIQGVLSGYTEVVFADLNVPLNLLWVSVKPKPGLILEVYDALKHRIPEAVLIGPYVSAHGSSRGAKLRWR